MIRFLVVSSLIFTVFSKEPHADPNEKFFYDLKLKKDEPLELPASETLTLQALTGTIYSTSFSQLKATDLRILHSVIANIEPGGLCSSPTLRKLKFDANLNFTLSKEMLKNCENLEELQLETNHPDTIPIDPDAFQNLPNLKKLSLKNLDTSLTSQSLAQFTVHELHLSFKNLRGVEPGAVCSSSSLKRVKIFIKKNDKLTISQDFFKNCEKLEKLAVAGSRNHVEETAFQNLPNLISLSLASLQVEHVTRKFFKNLPLLEVLQLFDIHAKEIDADAFTDLKNLKVVEIFKNEDLRQIPEKLFENSKKLESLALLRNKIESLSWDEFKGLTALKKLNLGRNGLTGVDGEKIAQNLPSLNYFDLRGNKFDCEQLRAKVNQGVEVLCGSKSAGAAAKPPEFGF